jgi:uncharacterized membrane protein SirB2
MSLEVYKIIHILGILMAFTALGGTFVYVANGGLKADNKVRKAVAISHGVGLLLILISGFGMLAKLGFTGIPPFWALVKFGIWLFIGAALFLAYKKPAMATKLWALCVALGCLASIFALYKIG